MIKRKRLAAAPDGGAGRAGAAIARARSAPARTARPRSRGRAASGGSAGEQAKDFELGDEAENEDLDEDETGDDDEEDEDDDGSSDDSEDDAPRNRIGNVPLRWYDDEDHVGYDLAGERVMREIKVGEIDALLESADNPDAWRTIKDHKNQREIVLTDTDLEIIRRIRSRLSPNAAVDNTTMVEFENKDAKIHPIGKAHPPKRRFLPSKWERMHVKKLVALLREGKIKPPPPPAPEVWDLWADDPPKQKKGPRPLPAPKAALPGHASSYNPPEEFLLNEEEKKAWEDTDEQDRAITHLPQKFDCLRRVPAYETIITERFNRCLDLYLVPRALRQRMNVDPESILPKLPSPKDLRPFPTHVAVAYEGHQGLVRSVAVDPSGQWLATASSDKTVRVWEVSSGRQFRAVEFEDAATAVAWNPQHAILTVAASERVYFLDPGLEPPSWEDAAVEDGKPSADAQVSALLSLKEVHAAAGTDEAQAGDGGGAKARATRWRQVETDSALHNSGCRIFIASDGDCQQLTWHAKGSYLAAVSPKAKAPSNQCIIHALQPQRSMRPFTKLKGGKVQCAAFHPTKPHFLVATMRSVRIYDLQKQVPLKQLISGARWISSLSVHPTGDHVLVGSYDRRIVWFDLDLGTKPYKTLQYHDKAVRRAAFHPGKFPLFAACSDDGTVSVLHGRVSSDLMQSPTVVPVKRLREHRVREGLGVLDCCWHPSQPWLFTAGADHQTLLWA